MLSNYLCTQQVLRGTFWKIRRIQIQIYPETNIERKYGTFYLNNEARVHELVLLAQLSWRVASPLIDYPQILNDFF